MNPRSTSREKVHVVFLDKTSISPDANAGKRVLPVRFVNLTLVASPRTAAASALQYATSKPCHLALSSVYANPGKPVLMPHCKCPRALTFSKVDDTCFGSAFLGSSFGFSSQPIRPPVTIVNIEATNTALEYFLTILIPFFYIGQSSDPIVHLSYGKARQTLSKTLGRRDIFLTYLNYFLSFCRV